MKTAENVDNVNCTTKFFKLSKCDQEKAMESLNGENYLNDDAIGKFNF